MNFLVFVGILAFAGYASAQCGCLKCSKHLSVVGKSVPVCNCAPATIISRETSNAYVGQCLPIRVQTPAAVQTTVVAPEELRYRVVERVPSHTVRLVQPCTSIRYDAKVEVPLPTPTAVSSATFNLKPCVDRIVVPSCPKVVERKSETVYVNHFREAPVYVNPVRQSTVYSYPVKESPVYVNPIRGTHYGNPIRETTVYSPPVVTKPIHETSVYVNPPRRTSVIVNPPRPSPIPCSGPILGNPILKKFVPRYENSDNPFLRSRNVSFTEKLCSKNRSKREVPFLRHGYKFMVNMLPEFMQEPIKSTVNDLALTHPDRRLQRMYNQPPKLTLIEKLEMQRKKNLALLKSKLRNRIAKNDLIRKPYTQSRTANHPENTGFNQFLDDEHVQGSSNVVSARNAKQETPDFLGNISTIKRKQKITQLKKDLLLKKLQKLSQVRSRSKRSTIFEKHWSRKSKRPSKRRPNLLDTSEIVLPFYQVKEESEDDDPWENSPRVSSRHRYRRDDPLNFLEPYSFKDVANDNYDTKEHFLRSVIREELGKYKTQKEKEQDTYLESSPNRNMLPHSPVLHVITFPLRLISQFSDLTKQAFPMLGSLPQVVTGTKRYFRDFGKNFKKNMLHLTSDLIGDFENLDIANTVFGPVRQRRSPKCVEENFGDLKDSVQDQYKPNYFLVFDGPNPDPFESRIRKKRYLFKKVDEDEIEEYLLDKLGAIFDDVEGTTVESYSNENYPLYHSKLDLLNGDEESEKKLVLQHLKPKLILDNNGKPFLEINGYKRPLFKPTSLLRKTPPLKRTNKNWARKLKTNKPFQRPRYYDTSDEADSDKIDYLIHHAKNHMENNLGSKYSEMPIKTVKEKISQLLFETDILVHMDFERYDDIYDDLIALQHMKNSIVQDWKRLIMSKDIDDIGAKTLLLERFKELQYYKDVTLTNVVASLHEDCDNVFIAKKLIKMLVRLQKLQCLINQVVSNFQGHLHISSKSDIDKEIKYADFLNDLCFAKEKSRNEIITNLTKDRDAALQRNIFLLDKLKKLLKYEVTGSKVEKEAKLLWEMKNIGKMQKTTIEDMKHRLDVGYKIKNELKILFDLLKRYETCEENQKKLLSRTQRRISEEDEVDKSSEEVQSKRKKAAVGKKIDLEELKEKWQERLRKRNSLLRKQLRKTMRKFGKKSKESDDD